MTDPTDPAFQYALASEGSRDLASMVSALSEAMAAYDGALKQSLLGSEGHKLRRNLLVVATVLLAMSWGGLVPEKIDQLGIEFSQVDRNRIVSGAMLILVYHCAAFAHQAWIDAQARVRGIDVARAVFVGHFRVCSSRAQAMHETPGKEAVLTWLDEIARLNFAGVQVTRSLLRDQRTPMASRTQLAVDLAFPLLYGATALLNAATILYCVSAG